jgi:hypothetical protein
MSYSNFKLETVKSRFNLNFVRDQALFTNVEPVDPSHLLQQILETNVSLALAIHTEKARSEMIVAPILIEVRRRLDNRISLFSGTEFNVDKTQDLHGVCDFLISLSPEQLTITAPIISVVEAKNDNIKNGIPQCIAEMVASKRFNEMQANPIEAIYGLVTTGSLWHFLKLTGNTLEIDLDEYYLSQVNKIIGILISIIEDALAKQK